ncbi:MAG: response regulator transcription factor [Kangiellaceae bacterium]|nr:response regulator transcription factor [Kangiellaceae bacterium]MCW8999576.1 response regulator transcription factor [Kangiellaceae bacterium]MCW9018622.1 response regulator transcription factor [Kangiellaceae bacterium]
MFTTLSPTMGTENQKPIKAKQKRILLITDQANKYKSLVDQIENYGFKFTLGSHENRSLAMAVSGQFDLILIHSSLAFVDSVQMLSAIRFESIVPVFLIARNYDESSIVIGLENGADDLILVDTPYREVVARIKSTLRRVESENYRNIYSHGSIVSIGKLTIYVSQHRVEYDNQIVSLTEVEFRILVLLARSGGEVVTKEQLSLVVLGRRLQYEDRCIDMHICNLRKKLFKVSDNHKIIHTVPRRGYKVLLE